MENTPLIRETVAQLMAENAADYPDAPAFIFDGIRYTWREAEVATDRIAVKMLQQGIRKYTHIGFWSLNTIQLVFYLIAAMKTGAVSSVINYSYKTFELKNVLQRADMEWLFLGESKKGSDYKKMADEVWGECPRLLHVVRMEKTQEELKALYLSGDKPAKADIERLKECKAAVRPEDVIGITFTSGTTKVPKPVMLTHYNVLNNARQFGARMCVGHDNGDVLLAPLPLFHSSGLTGMLCFALTAKIPAVVVRSFKAEEALQLIQQYHVTVLMAVPSMLELLAGCEKRKSYDISSLRIGQTSGAGISPARLHKALKELGFDHFMMGYGQTECSPLICGTLYDDDWETILKTSGKPLCHVKVRIWDLKKNRELPPQEVGEIQVRGFNTMKGYYNSEMENREKFTEDGWLKTTDAGFLDERGYLHFAARISDIIIRHGENISPGEIESVAELYSSDIEEVKAVGVPEEIVQEEVACLVKCRSGTLDTVAFRQFIRGQIASYKVPKYVFQIESFPMTATGKTDMGAVRQMAARLAAAEKEKQNEMHDLK